MEDSHAMNGWGLYIFFCFERLFTLSQDICILLSHTWKHFQPQNFLWPPPQVNRCSRIFAAHQNASRCPCTFSSVSLFTDRLDAWSDTFIVSVIQAINGNCVDPNKNKNVKSPRKHSEGCFFSEISEVDKKTKARGVVVAAWGFSSARLSITISTDFYSKTVWV